VTSKEAVEGTVPNQKEIPHTGALLSATLFAPENGISTVRRMDPNRLPLKESE
jgi:hypothetical protein